MPQHLRTFQSFEYAIGIKYARVLNMPQYNVIIATQ